MLGHPDYRGLGNSDVIYTRNVIPFVIFTVGYLSVLGHIDVIYNLLVIPFVVFTVGYLSSDKLCHFFLDLTCPHLMWIVLSSCCSCSLPSSATPANTGRLFNVDPILAQRHRNITFLMVDNVGLS